MSNSERFIYLLDLFQSDTISAKEHDELFDMIASNNYESLLNRAIETDLAFGSQKDTADLPPHIAQEIIRNIYEAEKNTIKVLPSNSKLATIYRWVAAASIIIIIATFSLLYNSSKQTTIAQFAAIIPKNTIVVKNTGTVQQVITLSDNSKVTLAPNSSLHYSRLFAGENRDVYLEGEAFFQVTKNPIKPFLVYYGKIVTKVLGTSFSIKTNAITGKEEVAVRTGKVQVFENEKLLGLSHKFDKAITIVTPNQKAVYNQEVHVFENGIVDKPEKLLPNDTAIAVKSLLVFDQENLSKVLQQIQRNYGIEIEVESSNIYNCVFTGNVSDLDLFSVLQTICIATNSIYEINGTKILIKGKGCY